MTDLGHWESAIRQSRVWPRSDPGAKPRLTSAWEAPVLTDQVLPDPEGGGHGSDHNSERSVSAKAPELDPEGSWLLCVITNIN